MEFIDRLEQLMEKKGVTAKQMLEDCKLGHNSMQTWKQGSVPRFATLKRLADYFNVPVELLDDSYDGDYDELDVISTDTYLLSSDEKFIIDTYRSVSDSDKLKVMRIFTKLQKPES